MSQPEGGGPDLASLLGLGVALAAYLVAGLGLGWLADKAMDSLPICTLIGLALGIIAACVHVYAQFKTFFKE